jgi:hypothetical protein
VSEVYFKAKFSKNPVNLMRVSVTFATVLNQDINSIQIISTLTHNLNIWRTDSACLTA